MYISCTCCTHPLFISIATEVNVQSVEVLVLDEVDSLLQLGFERQVRQVEEKLTAVHQKLFFSATVPSRIEKMATELLQDPLKILVGEVRWGGGGGGGGGGGEGGEGRGEGGGSGWMCL